MTNNDVLRSARYMLDISEPAVADICALAGLETESGTIHSYLKAEEEEGYVECPDEVIIAFLNGLVIHKRGKKESSGAEEPKPEKRMNNNLALKKLRIAFELKEDDMHAIFSSVGHEISKPELSALFRKKGHGNYRACGDQILRYFLKGLTMRLRPAADE